MALTAIRREEVLTGCRRTLGLAPQDVNPVDNAFLAALVRHTAGFLCPCSAATLRSAALESLQHLTDDEELVSKIDGTIEGLIVGGDLLELSQVTTDDPSVKGTWLFAAPPSYVLRPSGSIFLVGIVADRDTYLPQALMARIRYDGHTRAIMPDPNEDLRGELAELGLQQLSQENWLKSPKHQTASKLRESLEIKLRTQLRSGDIPSLQIIDPYQSVTYYRGRWISPKKQTGMFVGRRPQEFGSPIWCFVELESGEPKRFLDFPLPKARVRGCDAAWHLQMAIDHSNGTPQVYRVRARDGNAYLDFYSPLPLWVERRLMIFGRHAEPNKCLLSYRLPSDELATEEQFLQKHLWLSPAPPASSGGN